MSETTTEAPVENAAPAPEAPEATSTPEAPPRPEWLPEKFASVEDAAKAYLELERSMSSQDQEASTDQVEGAEAAPQEQQPSSSKLDFAEFTQEYDATGTLSDDSLARLEEFGLPREFVQSYMEGHQALARQQVEAIWGVVGGQKNYEQMVDWASKTLDAESIETFNSMLDQSPQHAEMAVRGMMERFRSSGGYQPALIDGAPEPLKGSYSSADEWHQDMRSPRYKNDESFRKQVAQKLARSNIA